jgi:hypothetical protein
MRAIRKLRYPIIPTTGKMLYNYYVFRFERGIYKCPKNSMNTQSKK